MSTKNTHPKVEKQQMIELEKQIQHLEGCIDILQGKLQKKQKFLKDLQNYQNLVNLLYYNTLSKERDVGKIQDNLRKLVEGANMVINKLPPEFQSTVKEAANRSSATLIEKVRPTLQKVSRSVENHLDLAKNKIEENLQHIQLQSNESVEHKYKEYQDYCEHQGEKIASLEVFQTSFYILQNFKNELKEVNLFHIINQLDKDLRSAKVSALTLTLKLTQAAIEAVSQLQNKQDKQEEVSQSEKNKSPVSTQKPIEKQKYFKEWVSIQVVKTQKKSEFTSYDNFYGAYKTHLEKQNLHSQILTKSGFTAALHKQAYPIEVLDKDGQRLVKAKLK